MQVQNVKVNTAKKSKVSPAFLNWVLSPRIPSLFFCSFRIEVYNRYQNDACPNGIPCRQCNKRFRKYFLLNRHIQKEHSRKRLKPTQPDPTSDPNYNLQFTQTFDEPQHNDAQVTASNEKSLFYLPMMSVRVCFQKYKFFSATRDFFFFW